MSGERLEADVAIVGAGLAGLTAARRLLDQGLTPVVLEARDRLGGRTFSASIGDGRTVEMGGQFVGATHTAVHELLTEFGIGTFGTFDAGRRLLELDDRTVQYGGRVPWLSASTLVSLGLVEARLDRLARGVDPGRPWTARRALVHDATTLGAWLDGRGVSGEARRVLTTAIAAVWAAEPDEVNLLQALAYIAAAGGFRHTAGVGGGMQERRIVGGPAQLAARLAGDDLDVRLGAVVRSVDRRGAGLAIGCDDGLVVEARHVIVTAPPALAAEITFDPPITTDRARALRGLPAGRVIKVSAVYAEPFWRDRGLSGQAASTTGPVGATFDNSPPDGTPGVLTGFVTSVNASTLGRLPASQRRRQVLEHFARLFGSPAARPEQYVEHDWTADPFARGCYFGLAGPGGVGQRRALLQQPGDRVSWAGAETSVASYGGMDGAVRSGARAADEAARALQGASFAELMVGWESVA